MTTSTKALIGILIAGAVGIVIFFFVHFSDDPKRPIKLGAPTAKACAQTGECLPTLSFVDTNGVAYTPESLAGKVVVVNFWATWCHPCLKEIPDLAKVHEQYGKEGLVILGVMTDNPDGQTLLNFASDNMLTYPIVRGTREIIGAFQSPANLPTTFVYDRRGNLVRFTGSRNQLGGHEGAISAEKLVAFVSPLLAQK